MKSDSFISDFNVNSSAGGQGEKGHGSLVPADDLAIIFHPLVFSLENGRPGQGERHRIAGGERGRHDQDEYQEEEEFHRIRSFRH